jgi:hypothetical protein
MLGLDFSVYQSFAPHNRTVYLPDTRSAKVVALLQHMVAMGERREYDGDLILSSRPSCSQVQTSMLLLIMRLLEPIASLVNRTGLWSIATVALQYAYSRMFMWFVRKLDLNSLSDLWRGSCMYIVDNTRFRNVDSTQRVRMIFCHQSLCYSQLSLILQFMCSSSQFLAACDLSCWI